MLIVDAGAIAYDLDRRHCGASGLQTVAVLPPGVIHDGRPAIDAPGFRKRNLYLEPAFLPAELIGAAVDHTTLIDPPLAPCSPASTMPSRWARNRCTPKHSWRSSGNAYAAG